MLNVQPLGEHTLLSAGQNVVMPRVISGSVHIVHDLRSQLRGAVNTVVEGRVGGTYVTAASQTEGASRCHESRREHCASQTCWNLRPSTCIDCACYTRGSECRVGMYDRTSNSLVEVQCPVPACEQLRQMVTENVMFYGLATCRRSWHDEVVTNITSTNS